MRLLSTFLPRTAIITLLLVALTSSTAQAQSGAISERLERAVALISDNRIAEAERQLNDILRTTPEQADALNLLGTVRARQGRLDEAETLFKRAVEANPRLVGARMNLAYLYLLRGEADKTISELKEVISLDPANTDAGHKLARLLLSQNRPDECISFIEARPRPLPPALLSALGDAYLKKGDLGKAEKNYLLAINESFADGDALIGLAQISQIRGDSETALSYLSRAKGGIANSPDLLYRYSLIALASELHEEARSAIERAVQIKPDEPSYIFMLGVAWLKKADLIASEQWFRRFLTHRPDDPQGHLYLGYALLKQKKNEEAREWLEKSIQKNPSAPEAFYYLGLIAQERNENERAIELFEKAIDLLPSFAHAHVALGATYLKLKNYERARHRLETGVRLNPEDSKAHYNLALLYARLKDHARAQEEMSIVERLKNSGKGGEQDVYVLAPTIRNPH